MGNCSDANGAAENAKWSLRYQSLSNRCNYIRRDRDAHTILPYLHGNYIASSATIPPPKIRIIRKMPANQPYAE